MTQELRLIVLSKLTVGEEFARFRAARKQRLADEEAMRLSRVETAKERARQHRHIRDGIGKMLSYEEGWSCSRCGKVFT